MFTRNAAGFASLTALLPALTGAAEGDRAPMDKTPIDRHALVTRHNTKWNEVKPTDISGLARTLDLWSGVQTSSYQIAGQPVRVETCVHPTQDAVVVRIESPLMATGR